jgi:hypothetical protein
MAVSAPRHENGQPPDSLQGHTQRRLPACSSGRREAGRRAAVAER